MKLEISEADARAAFAQLLDDVCDKRGEYIVKRGEERMAAVIPIDVYEQFMEQRSANFAALGRIRATMPDVPDGEVDADIDAAIAEVRATGRAKTRAE
jgi:prevent-host-death family protein